jgi:hypothetical protein
MSTDNVARHDGGSLIPPGIESKTEDELRELLAGPAEDDASEAA